MTNFQEQKKKQKDVGAVKHSDREGAVKLKFYFIASGRG